ncbi:MAG: peptidoglycan-binding domain-containing protein [Candidatus Sedimenticola sp. PURPLELP]
MKTSTKWLLINAAVASAGLQGCATTGNQDGMRAELESMQRTVQAKEQLIQEKDQRIQELESAPASAAAPPVAANDTLLPPDAKPGECYARVWVPASYSTVSKEMLVKEASERTETIPARYEWIEEQVMTSEASSRLETIPAVYGKETETIKVKDAARIWKTGLQANAAPASPELLDAAKKGGIDLGAANPGMCFHEHYRPAKYAKEQQQVLLSEASEDISVTGPKYRMIEKQVLVKEASFELREIPAAYEWTEERIIDKPAHTVWQKGTGPIQRIDEATGEIMCLVEVPATYKVIKKRILKAPARTERVEIPAQYKSVKVRAMVEKPLENKRSKQARYGSVELTRKIADATFVWHEVHNRHEPKHTRTGLKICLTEKPAKYKTITKTVVKTPASVRKVEIPAEYKTVKVRKLVSSAQEKRIAIPAEYRTVTSQQLEKDGYMEWRSILCKTNMTETRIIQIQQALKEKGYNPGKIDGVVGHETMTAVNAFQKKQGLPVDRYLNIETIRALGVSPR